MTGGGSGGEEVVVVMGVEVAGDVGDEVGGVGGSGAVDEDFVVDGYGVEVEEEGFVGEGERVALAVELLGLDGIGGFDDDVVGHRIWNGAVDVRQTEEVLLVGGIVHTVQCGGGVLDAVLEGGVHFVGATEDGLAGTIALGVNEAQFLQGGRVGNKTGIEATTPLRLGKKSANYTDIPLRETADPELAIVPDVVGHLGGHVGFVEIGLDIGLQELAQAVDLRLGAGKEVVEDGFGGVEGHRSGGLCWVH